MGFRRHGMAVSFEYEWYEDSGQRYRLYGVELWEFSPAGLDAAKTHWGYKRTITLSLQNQDF